MAIHLESYMGEMGVSEQSVLLSPSVRLPDMLRADDDSIYTRQISSSLSDACLLSSPDGSHLSISLSHTGAPTGVPSVAFLPPLVPARALSPT